MPSSDMSHDRTQSDDRRPCILICNWDATRPVWDLVEDLSGVPWHPDNARSELINGNGDTLALAQALASCLQRGDARALLLLGHTRHAGPARLQLRAEAPHEDGVRVDYDMPGVVRATAPAADILHAVTKANVAIVATSDAEEDAGSALLYHVMTLLGDDAETLAVAMLRFAPASTEATIASAVKATASVMTQHLSPQARSSSSVRY